MSTPSIIKIVSVFALLTAAFVLGIGSTGKRRQTVRKRHRGFRLFDL